MTQPSRSGCPLIEGEQPAEPRAASHATRSLDRWRAGDEATVEPLVIPFPMIVLDEFRQGVPEVSLPQRNHPIEQFFFDRPNKALDVGVRVWRTLGVSTTRMPAPSIDAAAAGRARARPFPRCQRRKVSGVAIVRTTTPCQQTAFGAPNLWRR